jgi:DNA polymerase-3 subunit alpha
VAEGTIFYALAALKGVGTQAVEHLVQVRGRKPFADLADFAARIDPQMINRKALECLVQSGAFDSLEPHRAKVFENIGKIVAAAQERSERASSGISDLFGNGSEPTPLFLSEADLWAPTDRLQREFAAIGTYLSAHPVSDYEAVVQSRGGLTWNAFVERLRSRGEFSGMVAATVVQRQERRTRIGGRLGIVTLSDPTAQFEATVYQERLADWRDLLEPGQSLLVQLSAEFDPDTEEVRARIQNVESLELAAAKRSRAIRIFVDKPEPIDRIASRLDAGEGTVSVVVLLKEAGREVEVKLPGQYRVTPQIAGAIKSVPGIVHVELH